MAEKDEAKESSLAALLQNIHRLVPDSSEIKRVEMNCFNYVRRPLLSKHLPKFDLLLSGSAAEGFGVPYSSIWLDSDFPLLTDMDVMFYDDETYAGYNNAATYIIQSDLPDVKKG